MWYQVINPMTLKRGNRVSFWPLCNAMGRRPYWSSRMEVSYCTFAFGAICAHFRTRMIHRAICERDLSPRLRGVEWVHGLFLLSRCFRENVVATCKIGSFLCSLDNLLKKNVIALFFGNQISKWCSVEKKAIFDLLFTFLSHQGKVTKKILQHISHSLTYTYFAHPMTFFLPYQFWRKKKYEFIRYGFSLVWVLGPIS